MARQNLSKSYQIIKYMSKCCDFCFIENEKGKNVSGKIIRISNELTTLPDKLRVYEIEVIFEDNSGKIFSLSEMFEPEFTLNAKYKLVIVSDYIKGFEKYED